MAARWVSYGAPMVLLLSLVTCKPPLSTYVVDSASSVMVGGGNGSEFRGESLVSGRPPCDKMEEYTWYSKFHDCFVDRKYKDGGRDLNAIVDRILNHAETCVETSKRPCRLDYEGFKFLMNKVIEQMKDFSVMYMEAIYKGRESVKDLECVEDVLTVQTYVECFKSRVPSLDDKKRQSIVQDGLICANQKNRGCSREALTTFNRIVRTLLGQKHSQFESFTPSTTPRPSTTTPRPSTTTPRPSTTTPRPSTTTPRPSTTTPRPSTTTPRPSTTTPRPSTTTPRLSTTTPRPSTITSRPSTTTPRPSTTMPRPLTTKPRPSTTRLQKEEEEPKSTPKPPMRWYDYIFQPFISAWNWVTSWFG